MMGEPLRVACVGAGYWGKNLVRVFDGLPDVQLKVVCDSSPEIRQAMQQQYGDVRVEADYDMVLKDGEVEAVVLAVPAIHHFAAAKAAKAALVAGKHARHRELVVAGAL